MFGILIKLMLSLQKQMFQLFGKVVSVVLKLEGCWFDPQLRYVKYPKKSIRPFSIPA